MSTFTGIAILVGTFGPHNIGFTRYTHTHTVSPSQMAAKQGCQMSNGKELQGKSLDPPAPPPPHPSQDSNTDMLKNTHTDALTDSDTDKHMQ